MTKKFRPKSHTIYPGSRITSDNKYQKCTHCNNWKARDDEHYWRTVSKGFFTVYCKECGSEPYKTNPTYHFIRGVSGNRKLLFSEREKMVNWFGGLCAYCSNKLGQKDRDLVVEHFKCLSKGGEASHDNLLISCRFCNQSKKDKIAEEWIMEHFGIVKNYIITARIAEFFSIAHTVYKFED